MRCSGGAQVLDRPSGTFALDISGRALIPCQWEIRAADADAPLTLRFTEFNVWSGSAVDLADLNGTFIGRLTGAVRPGVPGTRAPWPAFSARGGISVTFRPDGQQYRVYNLPRGDRDPPSFVAEYNNNGCASDAECSGSECDSGVCTCAPNHYGADCAAVDECIGTTTSTAERGTFLSAARALQAPQQRRLLRRQQLLQHQPCRHWQQQQHARLHPAQAGHVEAKSKLCVFTARVGDEFGFVRVSITYDLPVFGQVCAQPVLHCAARVISRAASPE